MNHPHEQQAAAMDRAGELPDGEQLRDTPRAITADEDYILRRAALRSSKIIDKGQLQSSPHQERNMSDLDARVDALMEIIGYDLSAKELEQAIRAELQKPALHEAVTDMEVDVAIHCQQEVGNKFAGGIKPMRAVLESFLQGRAKPATVKTALVDCGECRTQGCLAGQCRNAPAKPAQKEISDADRYVMFKSAILGGVYSQLWNTLAYKAKDARLTGHEIDEIINAAIRASKGEKT